MSGSSNFDSSPSPFEDSLGILHYLVILNIEESGNIPIVHTFINNAEIIPDDFIVSPSPPKIVNQQPNIPIIANAPTIDDEDFSPPIDSSNHIQYNPPVFSSSPTHYNYSYDNEKPSSPVTYHDYKPTSEYYSIPPPPISDDNSPEPKQQQQQQQQYIHSPRPENHLLDLQKQQQEREKEKKQQEIITERKRLEYQRLQQKRQVIQQQQQIQLMKLKEKHRQIQQQQQQQQPDYQQQLQLEREKYLKIQQKIEAMKQQQHNQQPHPSQEQQQQQQYQQPPPQQQYQQQPPQQQYQQKQIQQQYQQRQPLIAKLESPKRNVKNAFESIHISSPSNYINHNSIIKEETSPIISPHKPKINLPVFDIDLDLHAKVNNNEENNKNEIMSPLFKEEKQTNKEEEEEEEDLPLWAKVASKKNTEKLPNQQNINETNNNNIHRRRQWNDEISKDIQKRREKYPPKQPDPPTLFAVKPTSLLIKWNENKNDKRKKYYKTDSYMLQYQIYPDGIWKNVGIGVIRNLNYTFDNLKSGYNYRFRIKSHNSEGWSIFSNCSEIYTVPGEKKKEDNNNNNKRIEMKIGNRREFSSIRKSSIDEDLKRKEIAERRNIYLYNGKYPKYSDKINKKRSVSEIKSRVIEDNHIPQQQQQYNDIPTPKYTDEPIFIKENKVPKLNLLTESYQKLQEEEAKLKSDLNTIDEKWERHVCRKPSSLPPPSVFGDDSSYLSYRSYYSEMPIRQNKPVRRDPSLPKRSRNTIGRSNK